MDKKLNKKTEAEIIMNTVPCGIIKISCEDSPRVKYISDRMLRILGFPKEWTAQSPELEPFKQSVLSFLPPEDRRRFPMLLSSVEEQNGPVSGEQTVLRFDGSSVRLFGWVSKSKDSNGAPELNAVCIDLTEEAQSRRERELQRYVKALSGVYDDIFELNYKDHTVTVLHTRSSAMLRWVQGIPMQMKEATESWILRRLPPDQQRELRRTFSEEARREMTDEGETPEIHYSVVSSSGRSRDYTGIFVKMRPGISLFCCRQDVTVPQTLQISGDIPRIRTFGYFDVFVGDKTVLFRNSKSKELLALLVDRRGGFVSSEEAIAFLWEDAVYDSVTLARYRKVALRLKNTLEEYGISDMIESVSGKRRIVTDRVKCDLYDYLSGKEEYSQLFKGSYLTNYSWAENTLAELTQSER